MHLGRSSRVVVAIAGAMLLVLIQIPWLEAPLDALGLRNSASFHAVVVTVLLTTLLLEVRDLSRDLKREGRGLQHFSDPGGMYQMLLARADEIKRPQQRTIDVLGLTLFSAWPYLRFWLEREGSAGWRIRFATLAADASSVVGVVPDDWPDESARNSAEIRRYAQLRAVRDRRHSLEVVEYDFPPGVHGFRLGNGDVFLSVLRWQDDGRLGKPGFTYEFVPCNDDSAAADAYRELFENWFARATARAAPSP